MKSGATCVSSAWQSVLHVKSSQDTINKKEKTKGNKKTTRFLSLFCRFSPVLPERSVVLLHGLDLWVLMRVFFLFDCGSHTYVHIVNLFCQIQSACPPEISCSSRAQPGYLPPLFLLMKHTMSRTKMRSAMAHISPMNHP